MMVQASDPSTTEMEAAKSQGQGHPQPLTEFKTAWATGLKK